MKLKLALVLAALPLVGCGTITLPAAVKMNDGQALVGTTTAAISGGTFQVSTPKGDVSCSGNYDALDTRPVISAPVRCSDGRYGAITVLRSPDGMTGTGTVALADGSTGNLAFGRAAPTVLAPDTSAFSDAPASPATSASSTDWAKVTLPSDNNAAGNTASPVYAVPSTYAPSTRVYTGNCPTPESIDTAGRRCGARSAASRPGGYDGYSAWAKPTPSYGGSVYVGGYYRKNGTYVHGYTRRR
ncbi:hypothetical protein HFN47_22450 [Rhizobium leguminosarum]|nr:hypothetical protein [Rhizobium leguminosarum]MBY5860584.1 hypothetical protein [Rhizobium leguminosarum]